MTTALQDFARRREQVATVLDELSEVAADAPGAGHASERLRALATRARSGRFVVQLVGCFSSGKSTLLNALLGRPVLPVKVNPCTAIPTALVHGEAPSVVVHHRDGTEERLDVEAFLERYQLRTDAGGAEAADRFGDVERAVVAWPLPLLRDGVVLLDTPGLDDDATRTRRTLASLPDADAVIFVLAATRFLTELERRTLRQELLPIGLTNLFFPVTMVDLLDALSDRPAEDLEALERRAREVLGPLSGGRFEERFFPLDARGGLLARWDRKAGAPREADRDRLAATGLAAFEGALERFLVEERGRAQLEHLLLAARRVREDLGRRAGIDRATAKASVDELNERQQALGPRFDELRSIARHVARRIDGFIERQQALLWQDLRDFLGRTEEELPAAVAGFDLEHLRGLDLLTPAGRERVEAQLQDQLDAWLAERVAAWQRGLRPRIEAALRDLRAELAAEARDFDIVADAIASEFAGVPVQLRHGGDREVDPVERWFSAALGAILLSPEDMAAGYVGGWSSLQAASGRLGARLAMIALATLLGPVGWAGLLLYALSDTVRTALTGGRQLARLREQVAARLRGQLVAQADAVRDEVTERVADSLRPLRDAVVGAAEADAESLAALLADTIAAREAATRDAEARSTAWEEALARFDRHLEAVEELTR